MSETFETFEQPEKTPDLQPEAELPSWMKENLEQSQEPHRPIPSFVLKSLEELEQKEQPCRALEEQKLAGGILRETFLKPAEDHGQAGSDEIDVKEAMEEWHHQEETYSCANACQAFIINEFLDQDVEECDLNAYAREQNWLKATGTPIYEIGNFLELYGIETHRYWEADINDIREALSGDNRAIVCVNNNALDEEWCGLLPVVSANHAIEVLDIDETDPDHVKVIINDPGVEDGCGKEIDLDVFERARSGSGGFLMVAERPEGGETWN